MRVRGNVRRERRSLLGLGVVLAVVLVGSGCQLADWDVDGQFRPSYCDPTDTAVNDGHHGGTHTDTHYPNEKGPLSATDCLGLNIHLNRAKDYAAQFPTAGVAEANGWHHLAPFISGQGTHHVNIDQGVTGEFNPDRPNMLMYDSNADSGKLTGMVWAVDSGPHPPAGFAGDNDHWHYHEKLCYAPGPYIIGDNISDAECTARGGVNQDNSNIWLLHVWLPEYEGWQATDIFNKDHPGV